MACKNFQGLPLKNMQEFYPGIDILRPGCAGFSSFVSAFFRRHKKPKRSGARSSPIRRPKELSYSTTRKIYNNKGTIVEQYEPFFDKGFDFSTPLEVTGTGIVQGAGVSVKLFYDPLGRVIRTVNPDSSEQWVLYGIPNALNTPGSLTPSPWESYTYDANDLAPLTNPSGSNVPGSHWYTPKNAKLDALGRTVLTREFFDNSDYSNTIDMQYRYDIRGNLLVVKDPYSRVVFEHVYDLRPPQKGEDGQQQPLPPLRTLHIDKGLSTVLFDASGKPVESHDAKGAQTLSAYDVISRPAFSWAKNKTGGTITLRGKTIYGEGHGVAVDNLKGKVYESYDEAGRITFSQYDFKGNVLSKMREVVKDDVLEAALDVYTNFTMDWDNAPALSLMQFVTDMRYDALNRVTELILPTDLDAERKKFRPAYNKAGALEKVDLYSTAGGGTTTNYVENIAYNAKGQRLLIAFGNSVMTRYTYDTRTFRLQRQRSEKYSKSIVGNTVTYAATSSSLRQDDGFNYDLIGNIVKLLDRMKDCGIGGTPDTLDRTFEYDPLYRLTYADGRESSTQHENSYLYQDAPAPVDLTHVRAYSRTYSYDKLGNVLQAGTNGFTRHYNYTPGKNTLDEINDGASSPVLIEDYTYDANGNQITAGASRYYSWNHSDQLICYKNQAGVTPTVYTQYDYAGQDRVSKLVRTGTSVSPIYERTVYIDGIFEYVKLKNTSSIYEKNYIHIMDDKSRIAEVRIGDVFPGDITDSVTFIIENQIGSSVMRTDGSGTEIDREEYYPFGDSSLRTFTYKRYRYVGKEKDAESGLYYYGARYYAAWTCRFISVDPLAADYPFYTPYNYAGNKPVNKIDIDGMQEEGGSNQAAPTQNPNNNNNNRIYGPQQIDSSGTFRYPPIPMLTGTTNVPSNPLPASSNLGVGDTVTVSSGSNPKQVLDKSQFVGWGDPNLKGTYRDRSGIEQEKSGNCYYLAEFQTKKSGATMLHGPLNALTNKNSTAEDFATYINQELDNNHAVTVGINLRDQSEDAFGTDHYITIVGRGIDENGKSYFSYFDNATGIKEKGASEKNKLSIVGTELKGSGATFSGMIFIVTRVQKNQP